MVLRKLHSPDHFSSAVCCKRRVVSGFGVCVVASLVVFSLLITFGNNNSTTGASSSSSSMFSWFFSSPDAGSGAALQISVDLLQGEGGDGVMGEARDGAGAGYLVEQGGVSENGHGVNVTGSYGNGSGLEKGGVLEGTHEGNPYENRTGARGSNVEETPVEKSLRNSTQEEGNLVKQKGVVENVRGKNSTGTDGNGSVSEKAGVMEKIHEGNPFGNDTGARNSDRKESISSKTLSVVNISREENNGSIARKGGGIEEKNHQADFLNRASNGSLGTGEVKESHEAADVYNVSNSAKESAGLPGKCDIFNGRWVRDERKPFYPAGSCPHIDIDFNCHKNGRPDDGFLRWRWQPNHCDIPRLNATDFLERLRGKRLIFVGDSLNRNMWESLVCILRHSVKNKKRVYEMSGRKEFKTKGYYSFRFEDYNCSIDFVRSPFLVRELYPNIVNGSEDEKLRLDVMDETTSAYREADVVVFNTGHWWTHEKTSRGINYYQEGDYVYPALTVMEAYNKALATWARWVDENINSNKTQVVFRGYSLTHFSGGQWNSGGQCHKETDPIFNETFVGKYPSKMRALEKVLKQMRTPVIYLNISRLTDYRKDGHPSIYRKKYISVKEQIDAERSQDCSHWCLPGIPDVWNELLYASLLMGGEGSWRN